MNKKWIMFTLVSAPLIGCPYNFINDTNKILMVSEKVNGAGREIHPGQQIVIEAPVATDADKDQEYPGNGHAPEYVYEKNGNTWEMKFKIIEMKCSSQRSTIKASQLGGMADGEIDAGRFLIKRNDNERKARKQAGLGLKSLKVLK